MQMEKKIVCLIEDVTHEVSLFSLDYKICSISIKISDVSPKKNCQSVGLEPGVVRDPKRPDVALMNLNKSPADSRRYLSLDKRSMASLRKHICTVYNTLYMRVFKTDE